jgi:DNA-binding MarR family transcriptional regulator/GNAT superfamily N-acetyltransferase
MTSTLSLTAARAAAVRAFNRSYTRTIGLLQEGLLDTPYTLTEARVLFDLAQSEITEVVELRRALDLDAGYVSRILRRFEADGLIRRQRSEQDGRRQIVALTEAGRAAFRALDERSAREVNALLGRMTEDDQSRLLAAMDAIQRALPGSGPTAPVVIRPPEEGDLGWIIERHGALYAQEYGWDASFEHFVVQIMAEYVEAGDDGRRGVWIADMGGRRVGCIACTPLDATVAQLRLFLVEPSARGQGLGSRLVDECMRFARRAGYQRVTLWTYDVLSDARRIYQRAGFTLASEEPEVRFGRQLVGQRWERPL